MSTHDRSPGPDLLSGRTIAFASAFALLFLLLIAVSFAGIASLSAIRGYVLGEGLWTKAQKRAVVVLHRYALTGNEADYQAFHDEIAVTLGDRQAREELERADPDMEVVRDGFRQGGIPDHLIDGMARLFRMGRNLDFVDRAIDTWAEADRRIEDLVEVAEELRDELTGTAPELVRVDALLARAWELDDELTILEEEFSRTFNEGATSVERTLYAVLALLVLGLVVEGAVGARFVIGQVRRREEALASSEARYRELFQRNVVGVALLTREGELQEANEAFAQMLDWGAPDHLKGRRLGEFLELEGLDLDRPVQLLELRARSREGVPRWLLVNSSPLGQGEEGAGTILLTAMDITQEREARERLSAVMDTVEEGILSLTRDGTIQFANPAVHRLLLQDPGTVDRLDHLEVHWRALDLDGTPLEPEELPSARVFWTGRAVRDHEILAERKDGSRIVLLVNAAPLRRNGDTVEEVVISLRDITAHRKAAQALAASEARYRTVVNRVEQVLFQTDEIGRWTFLNDAWRQVSGHPVSESLGTDLFRYIHHEDRGRLMRELGMVLRGDGESWEGQARLVHRSGGIRWVELQAWSSDESAEGIAGTLTDVTERRELEERLARSRKMEAMGQLAGGVAHDFNNLLTVILASAELLREDLRHRPEWGRGWQEEVEEILRTCHTAATLTRQLLAFSRNQVVERVRLDLNDVVRGTRTLTRRLLPTSIQLDVELERDLPALEMSPTHVEQIILNMVINARDAMEGAGGQLFLRTRTVEVEATGLGQRLGIEPGTYVVLEVEDTGHGMEETTLSRIFEPFFSTKERERGSGMGLATVYGIVTQAGGAVDVESSPGVGTTFAVYLPPHPAEEHADQLQN